MKFSLSLICNPGLTKLRSFLKETPSNLIAEPMRGRYFMHACTLLFYARVVGPGQRGRTRPDCSGNRVEAGTSERENTPSINVKIVISNAKMANTLDLSVIPEPMGTGE